MSVYFANAGHIDLDVIKVMGVSVKTGDNPIGYFGTGLKFAIATLLRTGHDISLTRGSEVHQFTTRESIIRGQKFQRAYMNNEPLPFTTELGKNWQVWQAYRELHSNTMDEAGAISDRSISGDTVISVTGAGIEREYHNRDKIFIAGKPIAANSFLEVYEGTTTTIFYRGVRAGNLPEKTHFTYNILSKMDLTEDRTIESQWDVQWKLQTLIPTLEHRGMFMELLSGKDSWDQNIDFSMCGSPSSDFLNAAAANYSNMNAPEAARKMVDRDSQDRGEFKAATLSDAEHSKFLNAFQYLKKLGCSLSPESVEIVESLGPSHMAIYHKAKDQIFLARSTLDWGAETVVATLYEEWLHQEYHYQDKSRELQNFLFQRLVALSMGTDEPSPEKQSKTGLPF